MVEVDVKITASDLYDFNMKHAYSSMQGLLGSVVGALGLLVGLNTKNWPMVIIGVALLLYTPWTLFIRSRQAALTPGFKEPLHYVLNDDGLTISQGEMETTQDWASMHKAVSTGRSIILYTSRTGATIFPRNQLGDKIPYVVQEISSHMDPKKVRIKS